MIRRQHYPELDLIVHIAAGRLEVDDLIDVARSLYEMDPPPLYSLWELADEAAAGLSLQRMREIQSKMLGHVRGRDGGKTAIVAPSDFTFGSARQYVTLADARDLAFDLQVFRTRESALEWLGIEESAMRDLDADEALGLS